MFLSKITQNPPFGNNFTSLFCLFHNFSRKYKLPSCSGNVWHVGAIDYHTSKTADMSDFFKTIKSVSEGIYKEKMSKFLSFAIPVESAEDAKAIIKKYQKEYYDARHVCWAYMVGTDRTEFLSSDNGEPSGTAGKPILGQINSFELTNILIVVVRYFGGIKLGTSGLIVAYREAAAEAIKAGEILECREQGDITFTFPYLGMNDVMKLIKSDSISIVSQDFDNLCKMTIRTNVDDIPSLKSKIADIDGTSILD